MRCPILPVLLLCLQFGSSSPVEADEELRLFFGHDSYDRPAVSPGGRYLSFLATPKTVRGLLVIDLVNGKRQAVFAPEGQPLSVWQYWWIDREQLVYSLTEEDKFLLTTQCFEVRTRKSRPLPSLDQGRSFQMLDPLPALANQCLVFLEQGDRGTTYPDVMTLDVRRDTCAVAARNPGYFTGWMSDTQGVVRLGFSNEERGRRIAYYRPREDASWEKIPLAGAAVYFAFDASGRFLLTGSKAGQDDFGVGTFDTETMALHPKIFRDPPYDAGGPLSSILTDPVVGRVVGLRYEADQPRFLWFDAEYREVYAAIEKALPGMTHRLLGFAQGNQDAIVESSSDREPGVIARLDRKTRQLTPIAYRKPGLRPEEMARLEPIRFAARDGVAIHAYLTQPRLPHQKPTPGVVLVHGGPFTRDTWKFDPEVQFLARQGYTVLQVNYRGSAGYGSAYGCQDNHARIWDHALDDVADGVRWAVAEGYLDPGRIAIMGDSFGGYAAVAGAVRYPELYRAAIGFAGVYDWKRLIKTDRFYGKTWVDLLYRDIEAVIEKEDGYSPIDKVERIRCPVYLFHGRKDRTVPVEQSERLYEALRASGKEAYLFTDYWLDHSLDNPGRRIAHYREIRKILANHLAR